MFASRRAPGPAGPPNQRAYVIGDIHGRLDLLEELLAKIHADVQHRPVLKVVLAFVGDLIDRGPSSAQVIERLRTYSRPGVRPVFILGNHEEVLLRILGGDRAPIRSWLQFGGLECLQSYGVDPEVIRNQSAAEAVEIIRTAIPPEHSEFLRSFVDSCRFGDYLFVHAGVRPGIALEQQSQADLRWIREPFLSDETDHGFVVVHGHTISPEVIERANRIGIDTGAYRTGVLTALVIDGHDRRIINSASQPQT